MFRTNHIPDREISLDEGMLGWRGHLQFRVYNPSKITYKVWHTGTDGL